jgi:hypothetical protein
LNDFTNKSLVRELGLPGMQRSAKLGKLPPIGYEHFAKAFLAVKKSISPDTIEALANWDKQFGSDLSTVQSFSDSCKTC